MKKLITLAAAGALAVALLPATSHAKPKQQVVEGTIMFPALFAQDTFASCWGGLQRRISTASQGQLNGVTGYQFEVDKATWNKNFVLEVNDGGGTPDLDLFLYIHYPSIEEWPDDPVNAGTPTSIDFTTRAPGGESGKVPPSTIKGIVCLYGGPDSYGYNTSFTYTAGAGVKPPKD